MPRTGGILDERDQEQAVFAVNGAIDRILGDVRTDDEPLQRRIRTNDVRNMGQ